MEHRDEAAQLVAGYVSDLIESSDKSLRDVSRTTHIPLTTLSRRLSGTVPFTVTELAAIASMFGTTVSSLADAATRSKAAS